MRRSQAPRRVPSYLTSCAAIFAGYAPRPLAFLVIVQRLVVRLLGKPELSFDGKPWIWKAPPRVYPLLALLVLHRGAPLLRRSLAIAMWPDDLEAEALTK